MINSHKITLLGAGIGDPDLITVKGMKALQTADVVLYDALANAALLDYAPENCVKIFVGKRADDHTFGQQQINEMLVQNAQKFGHAVRLKGGDPFVFGRGHEEMQFAQTAGIPVEVIPGISSTIAAPELAGIPVTRRGMSDSFWVLTGNTTEGVKQSFAQIADELRQQYSIGYYPKNQARKKEKRRIKVSVSIPESKVKTRENYIYKPESQ